MRQLSIRVEDRQKTLAYALVGNVLPIAIATATDFESHPTVFFIGAAGACIAPIGLTFATRRHPVPFYLCAFGGIPALTMLQAYSGGPSSGYAVLMMMAMVWFGLFASDREILAGFGVFAVCAYGPMLIWGAPAYPLDWGHATLLLVIGGSVAGSLRTVTREMAELNRRLREQATADELTGLLNRRGWREAADRELARSTRSRTPLGLVALDLDELKAINDTRGHDEGDRVLRETAQRMRETFRPADTLARIGGDEFVALLCDATPDDVLGAVQRLRDTTPPLGSFSAGVVTASAGETLDELMRRADLALYAAKNEGRSRVSVAPRALEQEPTSADPA